MVQLRVVQADVDSGGEGFVKVTHTVSCEEENPCIVLEDAKENWCVVSGISLSPKRGRDK